MRAFVLKQHAVGKKSTATTRPRTTTPARPYRLHPVLALQRTVGNRAVQRILRAAHLRSPKRERGWLPSAVPQLLRSPDPKPPQTAAPKQPLDAGWTKVNELGIVWKEGALSEDGGANIHETPDGRTLEWLPQQTKVHILSQDRPSGGWYAVTAFGKSAQFGYIQQTRIWRNLPDPESEVALVKPGETPLGLAARHYGHKGFNVWGKDLRYVVNALVWVNSQAKHNTKSGPAIEKKDFHAGGVTIKGDDKAPWWTAQLRAGSYLWLPGVAYLNAIYDAVAEHGGGTGSITADLWRNVKKLYHYVAYGLAFAGGLIHGFFKSLWDAVAGLAHLIYDILKSLFTGHIISDAKELAGKVHDLKWSDIKEAFGAWAAEWADKLDSDSPWVAGHAHGYLTGYVMAEAAMLLLSGGAVEEIKAAVWGSKIGKALEGTSAVRKFVEGANELRKLGGKTRETLDKFGAAFKRTRVGKVAVVISQPVVWTARGVAFALRLPGEIVSYLSERVVAGLKRFEPAFERIKKFSDRAKRWLFGCHSPCDCDLEALEKALKLSDDEIEKRAAQTVTKPSKPAKPAPKKEPPTKKKAPKMSAAEEVREKVRGKLLEMEPKKREVQKALDRLDKQITKARKNIERLKDKVRAAEGPAREQAVKRLQAAQKELEEGLLDEQKGWIEERIRNAAREEALLESLKLQRPALNESTKKAIRDAAPKTSDGRFIDPGTKKPIDGEIHYGHKYGHEHRRLVLEAQRRGMTQAEFNEWVNSHPEWFQIESEESNLSHRFEKPGID